MTTHELAKQLLQGPNVMALVRGYEGGVDEIKHIGIERPLHINIHKEKWYYGEHELHYYDSNCYYCSDTEQPSETSGVLLFK